MGYRLHTEGVIEIATGAHIKRGQPGWDDYRAWRAAGNAPELMEVPLEPLADIAARLRSKINQRRNELEQSGFPYMDTVFDSNQVSAIRIANAAAGALTAMSLSIPYEVTWTAADNSQVPMTAQDVAGLPLAMAVHANSCHQAASVKKSEVQALLDAEDRAGLESYDVTTGWPT